MNIRTCVLMRLWCDFLDSSLRHMQTQPVYRDREDVASKSSMEPIPLRLLFSLYFVLFFSLRASVFPLFNGSQVSYMSPSTGAIRYGEPYTPAYAFYIYSFYYYFLSVRGEFICCSVICILSLFPANSTIVVTPPPPMLLCTSSPKFSERPPLPFISYRVISFHLHTIACHINQLHSTFQTLIFLFLLDFFLTRIPGLSACSRP